MPIESHVDEKRRCIVAKVYGNFTTAEIFAVIDRSVWDPKFRPGFSILSDHTEVGEPITPNQARQMVGHLVSYADSFAGARWAVVTSKLASYGMVRMLSILAERVPMDVEVFYSHEEAEAWLASSRAD